MSGEGRAARLGGPAGSRGLEGGWEGWLVIECRQINLLVTSGLLLCFSTVVRVCVCVMSLVLVMVFVIVSVIDLFLDLQHSCYV